MRLIVAVAALLAALLILPAAYAQEGQGGAGKQVNFSLVDADVVLKEGRPTLVIVGIISGDYSGPVSIEAVVYTLGSKAPQQEGGVESKMVEFAGEARDGVVYAEAAVGEKSIAPAEGPILLLVKKIKLGGDVEAECVHPCSAVIPPRALAVLKIAEFVEEIKKVDASLRSLNNALKDLSRNIIEVNASLGTVLARIADNMTSQKEMVKNLNSTVSKINDTLTNTLKIIVSVNQTLNELNKTSSTLAGNITALTKRLEMVNTSIMKKVEEVLKTVSSQSRPQGFEERLNDLDAKISSLDARLNTTVQEVSRVKQEVAVNKWFLIAVAALGAANLALVVYLLRKVMQDFEEVQA